jgi:hypothetical protein
MSILERFQPFRIEAADALAHGLAIKTHANCNRRGTLATTGAPDNLSALHALGWSRAGVG